MNLKHFTIVNQWSRRNVYTKTQSLNFLVKPHRTKSIYIVVISASIRIRKYPVL